MEDFKEEAYVLEKMEISEDDDEGFDYKEIEDVEDDIEDLSGHFDQSIAAEEDDLNDFEALKKKTEEKKAAKLMIVDELVINLIFHYKKLVYNILRLNQPKS